MRTSLLALVVLLAAAVSGCTPDRPATAETLAPEPTVGESARVHQALAAAKAYFAAFNDGDADAVTALLAGTAEFSDSFSGSVSRGAWEERMAWNFAQGTTLAPPSCYALPNADLEQGTDIACESATANAQIHAVGARPVPTLVRFSISPYGISEVREEYGRPDFLEAVAPFREWVESKHPDVAEEIGFRRWDSLADAQQNGELTREYSRLWAAWLEANCVRIPGLISPDRDSYLDDC